jgi:halogenation protein CepH
MARIGIIGGGPGGSTAAAALAQSGHEAVLFEAGRHPRHHVGESLQPASLDALDRRFGIGPALRNAGFGRKYGAVYVWGESEDPWNVLFDPRLDGALPGLDEAGLLASDHEHAWNVDRSVFDAILFDMARQQGADLQQDHRVLEVLTDAARWRTDTPKAAGLRVRGPDGEREEVFDFVIDASGQSCLLGRAFGLTEPVPDLRCTATYGYWAGAGGLPGPLSRHVQYVHSFDGGWVWFIPNGGDRTSIGVVADRPKPFSEDEYRAILAGIGLPFADDATLLPLDDVPGLSGGQRLLFARDWSFSHRAFVGDGWLLLGDAACFVDPILSGGVDFAIRNGLRAALAVDAIVESKGALSTTAARLGAYEDQLRREYEAYLSMARYWYGNNRSVDGLFWIARQAVPRESAETPLRAFVYLTTGRYAADRYFKVFDRRQEERMFRAMGVDKTKVRR